MVAREGFEPSKPLGQQIYSLPRLTAPQPRHVPRVVGPACMIVMSGMDVPRLALVPKPGAGEGIRTPDRLITNQLLYRAELRQRGQSRKSSMPAARQQTPFRPPTRPRRRPQWDDRNLQVYPKGRGRRQPDRPCRRWRSASNRTIAVATETFRLPTWPAIGMAATWSHDSRTRRRRPVPSAPTTIAVGTVRSRAS